MKLTKSCSASKSHPRRSRLLGRWTDFKELETDDVKYLWATYKKGRTGVLNYLEEGLSPDQFRDAIAELILSNFDYAWTMGAETKKDSIPVGMVFGSSLGKSVLLSDATWFSWASKRNVLESSVNFINKLRKETHVLFACEYQHKHFYEHICKYGIARKACRLSEAEPALFMFEGKRIKDGK